MSSELSSLERNNSLERNKGLEQDSDFATPLERVNFEAGMLLGVEATRSEQAFHRRRLNRREYWFQGAGTLVGLAVSLQAESSADTESDLRVELLVGPGVGIDGLGREVMNHEPHCLNLGAWFESQLASPQGAQVLQDGLEPGNDVISLLVTMRYESCDVGLQPVLSRKVNAGTDPVQASRKRNGICLELIPSPLPDVSETWPWRGHLPVENPAESLTTTEANYLAAQAAEDRPALRTLAERLYSLPQNNRALELTGEPDEVARTLLAQVRIPLRPAALPAISPVINPNRIEVNNLVRPFIHAATQVAALQAQESEA